MQIDAIDLAQIAQAVERIAGHKLPHAATSGERIAYSLNVLSFQYPEPPEGESE